MARQIPFKYLSIAGIILSYLLIPGLSKFLKTSLSLLRGYDFHGLRTWVLSYGIVAPLASIALMVVQSVVPFVPGVMMTLTNTWLFGWMFGSLYSGIGALLGAALDFYLARWYGKPFLDRFIQDKYIESLNHYILHHGVIAVLIARLIPIVPFKVVSYSAGFSAMPFRLFILITLLGQMPAIVLYSILGQRILTDGYAALSATCILIIAGLIALKYRIFLIRMIYRIISLFSFQN